MAESYSHRLSLLTPICIYLSGATIIPFLLWIISSEFVSGLLFGISFMMVTTFVIMEIDSKKRKRSEFQSRIYFNKKNILLNLLVFLLVFSLIAFLSLKMTYIFALSFFSIFIFYLIYLLYRYSFYRRMVIKRVNTYELNDEMKVLNEIWIILNRMDIRKLPWYQKKDLNPKEIILTTKSEKKIRININVRPDWKQMKGFFIEILHSKLPEEIGDNFLNELKNEIVTNRKCKIFQN